MEKPVNEEAEKELNRLMEMGQLVYTYKYDLFKYFATLSSGAILFISAFLGQQSSCPTKKWLIIVSMFLFLLSMATSIGAMFFTAHESVTYGLMTVTFIKHNQKRSDLRAKLIRICRVVATIAFSLAVILVGVFFLSSY